MNVNQDSTEKKYLFIDLHNENLAEKEISIILYNITGSLYTFAGSSSMRWGANGEVLKSENTSFRNGFYQLMPERGDDGFFDWYCDIRSEQQFFKSKETCVLHFINYWYQWKYQNEGDNISK